MMKFCSTWCAFFVVSFTSASASATESAVSSSSSSFSSYKPVKISYQSLLFQFPENPDDVATSAEQESLLLGALHTVGMVTITDIPGMKDLKQRVLSWDLHVCATSESSAAKSSRYPDGTKRSTIATVTHSLPGGASHKKAPLIATSSDNAVACEEAFVTASDSFRDSIAHVTDLFASRLSSVLIAAAAAAAAAVRSSSEEAGSPLLVTKDPQVSFHSLADIVKQGEHLEHFHSYQHVVINAAASSEEEPLFLRSSTTLKQTNTTIDLHTDQGLFLVFTPGRFVQKEASTTTLSTGFFVELDQKEEADGTTTTLFQVDFDEDDDLAILLGDGVNQYVNTHYYFTSDDTTTAAAKKDDQTLIGVLPQPLQLRALPHALTVPVHDSEQQARVWYGRMVLPPSAALHPLYPQTTFGDIRQALAKEASSFSARRISMKDSNKDNQVLTLGCSSSSSSSRMMIARNLDEMEACAEDTLMCWHRCMNLTQYNVSQQICQAQGKELVCINPRGQLWDQTHGDFYPGCATNDTEIATPFPTLPNYPRDEQSCSNASFDEFLASFTPSYQNKFDLGKGAIFLWNVTKEENGSGSSRVQGRIVFNGLLGFLAFGLANVGGAKNGMHGANIFMAIPGGDYSPTTGFNLSIPPSVQEHEISTDSEQSSYRFWGMADTNESSAESRNMEEGQDAQLTTKLDLTDCFSSFAFDADQINGVPFNFSGVDELLWSANNMDYYAGYHGNNRGRFSIDWTTGVAKHYDAAEDDNDSTSGAADIRFLSSFMMMMWLSTIATVAGILMGGGGVVA